MYALKRIIAYVIDMTLIILPIQFYGSELHALLGSLSFLPGFLAGSLWMLQSALPILVLGICVGCFGKTPGKLLMFLKVVNEVKSAPGIANGLLREVIKMVGGMFFLGALYALYGIITSGKAFYDDWLSLDVEDQKPMGLSERQKKWREYSKTVGTD